MNVKRWLECKNKLFYKINTDICFFICITLHANNGPCDRLPVSSWSFMSDDVVNIGFCYHLT